MDHKFWSGYTWAASTLSVVASLLAVYHDNSDASPRFLILAGVLLGLAVVGAVLRRAEILRAEFHAAQHNMHHTPPRPVNYTRDGWR